MTVGILAYGSLLDDPGPELRAVLVGAPIAGTTKFGVAFARLSAARGGAPILTKVTGHRGVTVNAGILGLAPEVTMNDARAMLFRRDTHRASSALTGYEMQVGWIKVAVVGGAAGEQHGRPAVALDDLFTPTDGARFGAITTVLYVDRPPIRGWRWWLKPGELANRAIRSARGPAGEGDDPLDGITYLQEIIAAKLPAELTERYERAILRRLGADDLSEAWSLARAQAGAAAPGVAAAEPAPAPAGAPVAAAPVAPDALAPGNDTLRDAILRVAGAIGTGIGVVGLVTLIGGAYFWLRFSSVGLPANEAVGDLSHSQLLVVGIRELYPFVAISIAGVLVLYLLELIALAVTTDLPTGWLPDDNARRQSVAVLVVRTAAAILAVAGAIVIDVLQFRHTFSSGLVVTLVAGGLALAVIIYAVVSRPPFVRFVLAALAATAGFALFSSAFRISEDPKVRPVVLIDNGKPLGGIYITATSDDVYVGEVCEYRSSGLGDANTGSLLAIPRAGISLMLIGDNAGLKATIVREGTILTELPKQTSVSLQAIMLVRPTPNSAGRPCTSPEAAALAPSP